MPNIYLLLCLLFMCLSANAQQPIQKARIAFEQKQFFEAIRYYEDSLKQQQFVLQDWCNLATCYRYQNKLSKAIECYDQARPYRSFRDSVQHLYQYAMLFKTLGKFGKARKWLKRYQKVAPKQADDALRSLKFAKKHQKNISESLLIQNPKAVNSAAAEFAPIYYDDVITFASSRPRKLPNKQGDLTAKNINFLYQADTTYQHLHSVRLFQQKDSLFTSNQAPIAYDQHLDFAVSTYNHFLRGLRQISGASLQELGMEIFPITAHGLGWRGVQMYLFNYKRYSNGFPAFSPLDTVLYFAANTPDGYGGFDIYKTTVKKDGQGGYEITQPQNLGPKINTAGDEICPFMDSLGTLYFTSDYHEGFGNYDIFLTHSSDTGWTQVQNLGTGINSPYDDFYFIIDNAQKSGYFSSNRPNGRGDYDIYGFRLTNPKQRITDLTLPIKN